MKKNSVYISKFKLRTSDFSCNDKLQPHSILDLFQEVAGEHADLLDIGYEKLLEKNLIWVLVRTKFEIIKNPSMHSTISVKTWPKEKGKIDFDREYLILDEDNNTLVKGISKWVIVNYKTRRISLTRNINYNCEISKDENFIGSFNKIDDFSVENLPFTIEKGDYVSLDHNGHINNIIYAKYVTNILSNKKSEDIISFEINYIKEMQRNQTIKNYYKKNNNLVLVKGILDDGQTCYIAKVILKMGL